MRSWDIIFHYGKTGRCLQERWTKLSDLSYFAHFQALMAPHGPLRVPKGSQWPTQCAMRSHRIFYYGMISLWENWVLLAWELDQEISEDLRHTLAIFRLCGAPKAPQGTTLCAMRSQEKIFYYGIISPWENWVFLHKRWTKEYLMILVIFWPFLGSEGFPKTS